MLPLPLPLGSEGSFEGGAFAAAAPGGAAGSAAGSTSSCCPELFLVPPPLSPETLPCDERAAATAVAVAPAAKSAPASNRDVLRSPETFLRFR